MFYSRMISAICLVAYAQASSAISLIDLYSEAVQADPRLISGQAEVGAGEAQQRQSLAAMLPQISLRSSVSKNYYQSGTSNSTRYRGKRHVFSVNQTLFNREQWLDHQAYGERVEQKRALLEDTTSTLAVDVTERYVDILSTENALMLIEAEVESTKIQLGLLRSRLKRQLAVKTDVLDVESRLRILEIDQIDAKNMVSIARESLTELVNREVTEPLDDFSDDIPYQADKSLQEWVDYTLKHNAYLRSFEREVAAAQKVRQKRKAAHLPSLSLQFSAQRSNIGYENAPSADTDSLAATISLSVPIYNGGAVSASEREQEALIIIAQQRKEQYKRQLVKSVREAYLNTQASWNRIGASNQAISAASKSHQAMEKGFSYGTVTVVEVLDAFNKKLQALLSFKKAQYDFVINYTQLQQFAGTLDADFMQRTSNWQIPEG